VLPREPACPVATLGDRDGRGTGPPSGPKLRHVLLFVLLQLIVMAASLALLWPLLSRLFG
jgi:hypothetical protein